MRKNGIYFGFHERQIYKYFQCRIRRGQCCSSRCVLNSYCCIEGLLVETKIQLVLLLPLPQTLSSHAIKDNDITSLFQILKRNQVGYLLERPALVEGMYCCLFICFLGDFHLTTQLLGLVRLKVHFLTMIYVTNSSLFLVYPILCFHVILSNTWLVR